MTPRASKSGEDRSLTEQLIQEVVVNVPRALIAEAVDLVIFIRGRGRDRRVDNIVRINGLDADGYHLRPVTDLRHLAHTGDPS